jgi:hypothetical protein
MSLRPGLLRLALNLALIIQCLSRFSFQFLHTRYIPRKRRYVTGYEKPSYIIENETQELLEHGTSSDQCTHENSSPN